MGSVWDRLGSVLGRLGGVLGRLGASRSVLERFVSVLGRLRIVFWLVPEMPRSRELEKAYFHCFWKLGGGGPNPREPQEPEEPREPRDHPPPSASLARFSTVLRCAHATLRFTVHK